MGIATAYHVGLGLPRDVNAWIRVRDKTGYQEVAVLVAMLLTKHPMIAGALARRYPVVKCDEHQDSSGDQHALVMPMHDQGAKVCFFGDPMQKIFKEKEVKGAAAPYDWDALAGRALFEKLDTSIDTSTRCFNVAVIPPASLRRLWTSWIRPAKGSALPLSAIGLDMRQGKDASDPAPASSRPNYRSWLGSL